MEKNDVKEIHKKIDTLSDTVGGLSNTVDNLSTVVENLAMMTAGEFQAVRGEMAEIRGEMATKKDVQQLEEKLTNKIDGLGRRMDDELTKRVTMQTDIQTIKEHVGMEV